MNPAQLLIAVLALLLIGAIALLVWACTRIHHEADHDA